MVSNVLEAPPAGRTTTLVALAALFAACATSGARKRTGRSEAVSAQAEAFPDRDEVESMKSEAEPDEFFSDRRAFVQEWKLEAPLPDAIGLRPAQPETPWEERLAAIADSAAKATTVTEGMNCVARQMGHFRLEQGAFPGGRLRQFIRQRCGVIAEEPSLGRWVWESRPEAATERLAKKWYEKSRKSLRKKFRRPDQSVGIWFGKGDDEGLVVVAGARRHVDLEPVSIVQESGEPIVLEGKILHDAARLSALRTEGDFGFGKCDIDKGVELPNFAVRCEPNPSGRSTMVDLASFGSKSLLGRGVLDLTVWQSKEGSRRYEPGPMMETMARVRATHSSEKGSSRSQSDASSDGTESGGGESESSVDEASGDAESGQQEASTEAGGSSESTGSESGEPAAELISKLVGAVRTRADLPEMTYHREQSREVRGLAARYFDVAWTETGRRNMRAAEKVARGAMAGWNVDARLIRAGFLSAAVGSRNPTALLEQVLASPNGRRLLLSDAYQHYAVGTVEAGNGRGLGALLVSYREVPETPFDDRVSRAVASLNEVRSERGSPELERDETLRETAEQLAGDLDAGDKSLRQVQRDLMQRASRHWRTRVETVAMITQSLDDFKVHPKLLGPRVQRASLLVAPFDIEGAAWASYAIVAVYRAPKGTQMTRFAPSPDRRGFADGSTFLPATWRRTAFPGFGDMTGRP